MKKRVRAFDLAVMTLSVIGAIAVSLPQPAHADDVTPPRVPADLQVPAGNRAFLVGHAFGTQDYVCLPSSTGTGFAWTLFTPEATLLDDMGKQIITHYFSPNTDPDAPPAEKGVIRVTWQHSRDTSIVFAKLFKKPSFDPAFVAPGAVPWLLLEKAGVQAGPTGGDRLTVTSFIQRVNTAGGVAPATGCASSTDIGRQAFMPYTADYFFYAGPDAQDGN